MSVLDRAYQIIMLVVLSLGGGCILMAVACWIQPVAKTIPQPHNFVMIEGRDGFGPYVYHDDLRNVTCWTVHGDSISCIPDSQL